MIERKYSLSEIKLVPQCVSPILSRKDVNTKYATNQSTLFASPMDTVIGLENLDDFEPHANICLPRHTFELESFIPLPADNSNLIFYSVGMSELKSFLSDNIRVPKVDKFFLLLDIANGHMAEAINLTKKIKDKFGDQLILMVGNIANPATMVDYAHADYIRVGIGGGSACLTSTKTGVHYPMASLIRDCYITKENNNLKTKIVADGGMESYSDIIVSLALGADHVMLGKLFNKAFEAIGPKFFSGKQISRDFAKKLFEEGADVYNLYRGMSTTEVQKTWSNKSHEELRLPEGTTYFNKISYTLESFMENFTHNLSSAMSYCGCQTIEQFIGLPDQYFVIVSDFAHQSMKNKPNYGE